MDVRYYTLEELRAYEIPASAGGGGIVPLSPLRLTSYLKNPRSRPGDPVLFEMHHRGSVVAYRTLLPDAFYDRRGEPHRFAWLSGNYVDPGFRRAGISTQLLQTASELWEGRLMYTNYAPASKAVYDRTGQFPLLTRLEGKRFYLRASAAELLGKRLGSRQLLRTGDELVNRVREKMLQKFPPVNPSECSIEPVSSLVPDDWPWLDQVQEASLFRRDRPVFSWILESPWVTDKQVEPLPYHFTYSAERFENLLLKFTLPGDRGTGLLWMILHNRKLGVPYALARQEAIYPLMARTIVHTMVRHRCAYTTIRNPDILKHLEHYRKWFLSKRNMPQQLFVHKKLAGTVPSGLKIHDGDGDVVFTG